MEVATGFTEGILIKAIVESLNIGGGEFSSLLGDRVAGFFGIFFEVVD
jgi:hypothetical protein